MSKMNCVSPGTFGLVSLVVTLASTSAHAGNFERDSTQIRPLTITKSYCRNINTQFYADASAAAAAGLHYRDAAGNCMAYDPTPPPPPEPPYVPPTASTPTYDPPTYTAPTYYDPAPAPAPIPTSSPEPAPAPPPASPEPVYIPPSTYSPPPPVYAPPPPPPPVVDFCWVEPYVVSWVAEDGTVQYMVLGGHNGCTSD